jgi:hypothetical protein
MTSMDQNLTPDSKVIGSLGFSDVVCASTQKKIVGYEIDEYSEITTGDEISTGDDTGDDESVRGAMPPSSSYSGSWRRRKKPVRTDTTNGSSYSTGTDYTETSGFANTVTEMLGPTELRAQLASAWSRLATSEQQQADLQERVQMLERQNKQLLEKPSADDTQQPGVDANDHVVVEIQDAQQGSPRRVVRVSEEEATELIESSQEKSSEPCDATSCPAAMPEPETLSPKTTKEDKCQSSPMPHEVDVKIMYLPKMIKGSTMLEEVEENSNEWRATDEYLKNVATSALRYRYEKRMDAIMREGWEIPFGETIQGTDEGDGWVKIIAKVVETAELPPVEAVGGSPRRPWESNNIASVTAVPEGSAVSPRSPTPPAGTAGTSTSTLIVNQGAGSPASMS